MLKKSALQALDGAQPSAPQNAPTTSTDFRPLDRAVAKTGLGKDLSDAAYKRMERAFAEEKPENSEAWVKDYFDGFGAAGKPTNATTPPPPAAPQNAHPGSDAGAPARSETPLAERDVLTWTESDVNAYVKQKGVHAYAQLLKHQLRTNRTRVTLKT
jgi:hypothetical protein